MSESKSSKGLLGTGIVAAIAASLCCITPVLALIAGASGAASTFSWLDPARPYLIGITILVLGFAWYQKLKPRSKEEIDCACEDDEKPSFWQSKKFLGIVTVFAGLMLAFPLYADVFYPKQDRQVIVVDRQNVQTATFSVSGMTCTGCEEHVSHEVNKLDGIVGVKASYENENAIVQFDSSKTSVGEIEKAINSTGYKVTDIKNQ
ncbi:MAG TPA: mercuric transport protein MerTP [Cryomorphaceae bacterium]|nr:heavy metal transporter [Owenweeksia sp.]HAD96252.1 mercuric transport protein MerTP [Cryomorphaceae bacterium]HBF20069.1 mercuric transport protein MerTP [Cryomorphaceae bacterium]|tara:strand:- start:40 stop:654 length:615 start_codon:yes stop_codon:yes gene_type:complete